MAKNAANHLTYYLLLDAGQKHLVAAIRHLTNIKLAQDGMQVWLKDIDLAQLNTAEIRSIPYASVFYEQDGKLYRENSALPDRTVPALLWTPIDRAIPIALPALNHNYFGIGDNIDIKLAATDKEVPAMAMIANVNTVEQYIANAAAIRLKELKWALLNKDKVLIVGTPLLPISGNVYWQRNNMLLPAGYDLELYSIANEVQRLLNPELDAYIIWHDDSTYALVEKDFLGPLRRDSFKQTLAAITL